MEDNEGGYLLPRYIWRQRLGFKATMLRFVGKLTGNTAVYQRGMIRVDVTKRILEMAAEARIARFWNEYEAAVIEKLARDTDDLFMRDKHD